MADKSRIEWTDATLNTWYGCTKVSPGCANCYIERTPPYRIAGMKFEHGAIPVRLLPDRMELPLRWRRPRRIFVNSLSDTFHESVPDAMIDRLYAVMAVADWHVFQVLSKRPERMMAYITDPMTPVRVLREVDRIAVDQERRAGSETWQWPLPQVWLGVTAENQTFADRRIPILLETPAAVRFLSCEPLLSGLDLTEWLGGSQRGGTVAAIDWVITGGESAGKPHRSLVAPCCRKGSPFGPPQLDRESPYDRKTTVCGPYNTGECQLDDWRPTQRGLAWVRSLRDQCVAAHVPFHFKQWGGPRPHSGGRILDGRTWDEYPDKA